MMSRGAIQHLWPARSNAAQAASPIARSFDEWLMKTSCVTLAPLPPCPGGTLSGSIGSRQRLRAARFRAQDRAIEPSDANQDDAEAEEREDAQDAGEGGGVDQEDLQH